MVKVNFADGRLIEFPIANKVLRESHIIFLLHDDEKIAEFLALDVMNTELCNG